MNKNIGINVPKPKGDAGTEPDKHCPFTGEIKVRGRTFTGTVLSTRMTRTATISWSRMQYDPKYERYIRKWTKIHVHNPQIMNAQKGDVVKVAETRPISKTKNFVIVEILGTDIESQIKEESRVLDKKVKTEKDERKKKRKEQDAKKQTESYAEVSEDVSDDADDAEEEAPVEEVAEEQPAEAEEQEADKKSDSKDTKSKE